MNMQQLHTVTEQYFANLWEQSRPKWLSNDVKAASMADGMPVPVDYILTTVARLVEQKSPPLEEVQVVKDRLGDVGAEQFFYPADSIHITLLGCTQRYPSKDAFTHERIQRVREVCANVLTGRGTTKMTLRGVGIVGNQVFIQVFPHERKWEDFRRELEHALMVHGESPLTYPNKAPIHMNIMRVTDADPEKLSRILQVIDQLRTIEIGNLEVSVVDFLITDFVLSTPSTEQLGQFALSSISSG